ncbi:50S ribosomal protein L28 [Deinococcus fonticola]|uniref:50S ribosomal protein L28 n=1 Tax=Deinococcus fonticola TaxID=2528713 RepID=UPI00107577F1|nr:50S ribosomal protein L28 [Deinococcus fonticola]
MSRECYLTGKKNKVVNSVIRRGKARADGGVGRKTTGITRRTQKANLQKKFIRENGQVKRVWFSANALRTLAKGGFSGIELV